MVHPCRRKESPSGVCTAMKRRKTESRVNITNKDHRRSSKECLSESSSIKRSSKAFAISDNVVHSFHLLHLTSHFVIPNQFHQRLADLTERALEMLQREPDFITPRPTMTTPVPSLSLPMSTRIYGLYSSPSNFLPPMAHNIVTNSALSGLFFSDSPRDLVHDRPREDSPLISLLLERAIRDELELLNSTRRKYHGVLAAQDALDPKGRNQLLQENSQFLQLRNNDVARCQIHPCVSPQLIEPSSFSSLLSTQSRPLSQLVDSTSSKGFDDSTIGIPNPRITRVYPLNLASDHMFLSKFQCLFRKHIEVFAATDDDVHASAQGRNHPIKVGQVGIRCKFCASSTSQTSSRAVCYYPLKLAHVYQTAVNMASTHLCKHCPLIPGDFKEEMIELKDLRSIPSGCTAYWANGIKQLRVIETEKDGLRFEELP